MKEYTIKYTKSKSESLDDPFAVLTFIVYNERELREVLQNIEEHFDGIVIETGGEQDATKKKRTKK